MTKTSQQQKRNDIADHGEEREKQMRRKAWALAVATALMTTLFVPAAGAESAEHQTVGVSWHMQSGGGPVPGASATLVRRDDGVSYRINTNSLTPGNAYTLWLVVVNNPDACDPKPCTGPDIILDASTDSQVLYGKGHIAGASGKLTLAGSLAETESLEGWLSGRSFDDARTVEFHLVTNDHGPMLAEFMPDMIKTYRGGCSDDSPFPGIFPDTAINDGEEGPNTCILSQAAIFTPPSA
jgi:hypothetical protein